jgi:rhodanese-related sulfurtransferase
MNGIKQINPDLANDYLQAFALLIDLREGDEVEQLSFKVPCVNNIAYSLFDQNYMDIPKDRNILFACQLGADSAKAAQFLVEQGWDADKIFTLSGGIDAWEKGNFPTIKIERGFTMGKASFTQSIDGSDLAF